MLLFNLLDHFTDDEGYTSIYIECPDKHDIFKFNEFAYDCPKELEKLYSYTITAWDFNLTRRCLCVTLKEEWGS